MGTEYWVLGTEYWVLGTQYSGPGPYTNPNTTRGGCSDAIGVLVAGRHGGGNRGVGGLGGRADHRPAAGRGPEGRADEGGGGGEEARAGVARRLREARRRRDGPDR